MREISLYYWIKPQNYVIIQSISYNNLVKRREKYDWTKFKKKWNEREKMIERKEKKDWTEEKKLLNERKKKWLNDRRKMIIYIYDLCLIFHMRNLRSKLRMLIIINHSKWSW